MVALAAAIINGALEKLKKPRFRGFLFVICILYFGYYFYAACLVSLFCVRMQRVHRVTLFASPPTDMVVA
jgi:hypothetical protein